MMGLGRPFSPSSPTSGWAYIERGTNGPHVDTAVGDLLIMTVGQLEIVAVDTIPALPTAPVGWTFINRATVTQSILATKETTGSATRATTAVYHKVAAAGDLGKTHAETAPAWSHSKVVTFRPPYGIPADLSTTIKTTTATLEDTTADFSAEPDGVYPVMVNLSAHLTAAPTIADVELGGAAAFTSNMFQTGFRATITNPLIDDQFDTPALVAYRFTIGTSNARTTVILNLRTL